MTATLTPDTDLVRFLDADDTEQFEMEREAAHGTWGQAVPALLDDPHSRRKLGSYPAVKLHIGNIPKDLTNKGLNHVFFKYGEILEATIKMGHHHLEYNYGFVTFNSRKSAAEAMCAVNGSPPLFLKVRYSLTEKQRAAREDKEQISSKFNGHWLNEMKKCPTADQVEEDWDNEMEKEEKIQEAVDKYFEDEASTDQDELQAVEVDVGKSQASPGKTGICARCGSVAELKCSSCPTVKYCGPACQRLDWHKHRRSCAFKQGGISRVTNEIESKAVVTNSKQISSLRENIDDEVAVKVAVSESTGLAVSVDGWTGLQVGRPEVSKTEGKTSLSKPICGAASPGDQCPSPATSSPDLGSGSVLPPLLTLPALKKSSRCDLAVQPGNVNSATPPLVGHKSPAITTRQEKLQVRTPYLHPVSNSSLVSGLLPPPPPLKMKMTTPTLKPLRVETAPTADASLVTPKGVEVTATTQSSPPKLSTSVSIPPPPPLKKKVSCSAPPRFLPPPPLLTLPPLPPLKMKAPARAPPALPPLKTKPKSTAPATGASLPTMNTKTPTPPSPLSVPSSQTNFKHRQSPLQPTALMRQEASPPPFSSCDNLGRERDSLSSPSPPSTASPPPPADWPPALTKYVERCLGYGNCPNDDAERNEMEDKLQLKIEDALNSQLLWTKDWAREPIPVLSSTNSQTDRSCMENSSEHHLYYKTEMCGHHTEGRCRYGQDCYKAHTMQELRSLADNNPNYKRTLCPKFMNGVSCPHAPCFNAHGIDDLSKNSRGKWDTSAYKSAMCNRIMDGDCKFGDHCHFAHSMLELKKPSGQPQEAEAVAVFESKDSRIASKLVGLELEVGSCCQATITHFQSPTEIYICPDLQQLTRLHKHLHRTGLSLPYDAKFSPLPGSLVLARSANDGYWYRGTVLPGVGSNEVTFASPDFGFIESVSLDNVREISARLAEGNLGQPVLAARCALEGFEDGTEVATEEEVVTLKKKIPVSVDNMVEVLGFQASKYIVKINNLSRKDITQRDETC